MTKHMDLLETAGDTLMSLIAEAGGEKSDYFAHMFTPYPNHTFRTIMYPFREEKDIPKGAFLEDGRSRFTCHEIQKLSQLCDWFLAISTPAHQDSGFLTLLQTFGFTGLELELDGVWYSVPPTPGTLVINVGEQLAAMSNNRFKATIHRVLDIGKDRWVLV